MKKYMYLLLSISIIISPFYIIKSGLPQISDILYLMIFIVFIFNYRIKKDRILFTVILLSILISMVNLSWGVIYSDINFILKTGYYIFNFIFIILIINLHYQFGNEVLDVLYKAISISVFIQIILSPFVINTESSRNALFFNNPNQLGYYALLSFVILTLLYYILKKSTIIYTLISIMILYLALLSNSSAVIVSIILILLIQIIIIFSFRLDNKQKIFSVLFIVSAILIVHNNNNNFELKDVKLIENTVNRLVEKDPSSQSIYYERRYDRIFENPKYLLLGAGEGAINERFDRGGEIHSTIFSFFFNYGLITTIVLLYLLVYLIKKPTILTLVILFTVHAYGLTHNGIRQPFFWLLHVIILFGSYTNSLSLKQVYNHLSQPYSSKKG